MCHSEKMEAVLRLVSDKCPNGHHPDSCPIKMFREGVDEDRKISFISQLGDLSLGRIMERHSRCEMDKSLKEEGWTE